MNNRHEDSRWFTIKAQGPVRDMYDKIKINIDSIRADENARVFAFTSAVGGEGKTITAYHVARSAALAGHNTLIVDADMRQPKLHNYFKATNLRGLSDVIQGSAPLGSAVQETDIPRLHLLTSGKKVSNPGLIVNSPNMPEFIADLKRVYDYVFIDTAPVLLVSETISIAKQIDGVIVVVRQSATNRKTLKNCIAALRLAKANVLGAVLNDVPLNNPDYRYEYRYYYAHTASADAPANEKKPAASAKKLVRVSGKARHAAEVKYGRRK
jgi:capsular exopolysaccharide synthesis family protein